MADQQPNIILLMDDQHRWDTIDATVPTQVLSLLMRLS